MPAATNRRSPIGATRSLGAQIVRNTHWTSNALHPLAGLWAGPPGDDFVLMVRQNLRTVCETLALQAAGIVWQQSAGGGLPAQCDHSQLDIRWPETFLRPGGASTPLQLGPAGTTSWMEMPEKNGSASYLLVPLMSSEQAQGWLWVAPRPERPLDEYERSTLVLVAGQFALACYNADLRQQLCLQLDRHDFLLQRLVQVSEEGRRHVARELHDEVSQSLAALLLQVETAQATLRTDSSKAAYSLEKLRGGLVQVLDEVHRLVLQLRPALLEQKGLLEALRWYGQQYLQPTAAELHVSGGQCAPLLSTVTRLTLYRIGQEAISNAARHSGARNVWLTIGCRDNLLILSIRDDGCGFDTAETLAHPQEMKGLGLLSMQERASLLGGALTIESAPARGTTVQLCVPLAEGCAS